MLAFIEKWLHLRPLTERDASADPLSGALDFTQEPRLDVPELKLRDCEAALAESESPFEGLYEPET